MSPFGRRVVTGPDGVVADGPSALTIDIPDGPAVSELLWLEHHPRSFADPYERTTDGYPLEPPVGGLSARLIRLPPGDGWLEVEGPDGEPVSLHATDTLDLVVVVAGEIVLATGDGREARLGPGDVVVQRGALHRWKVLGDQPCTYYVVMVRPDPSAPARDPQPHAHGTGEGGLRRVVTEGSALVDGTTSVDLTMPETRLVDLWHTGGPLASVTQGGDHTGTWALEPPRGGASFRIVELGPGLPHDGWHSTATVDLDLILSGRIAVDLPGDATAELGPGDAVLLPGVEHRWRVLGDETVRIVVTMLAPTALPPS